MLATNFFLLTVPFGRIFSSPFYLTSFQAHFGLNELHTMFPGSREKLPFFSSKRFDSRFTPVCKHFPSPSPLSPRHAVLSLQTLSVTAALEKANAFPDADSTQQRCSLSSPQKLWLVRVYAGGWSWRQSFSWLFSCLNFKRKKKVYNRYCNW